MVNLPAPSIPDWLAKLYPFKPKFQQLTEETRMSYVAHGVGEAVLMLHGNPTWSFFYRNLIHGLAESGFRCIAPDHVGCGLSDKPQVYNYCLEQHISNLSKLIDSINPGPFHLIVHDWGGAIGFGLADRIPERILSLTILNTAAFRSSKLPFRIAVCRLPFIGQFIVRWFNAFILAAKFMAVKQPLPKDVWQGFIFPYDNWNNRIAISRFVQDIPMLPSHPSWNTLKGIENNLPSLAGKPMQICWGMRDWCFSLKFIDRWRQIFPEAYVKELPDAGHYLLEDAQEEVIGTVRPFLEGVRASA